MEIWKDIMGYEGNYKISSYGNVWSKTTGILNNNPRGAGYITVGLWKNNKRVNARVHRLVASHFIDNPNNLPLVDHINNVRHDNNVNNLRWTDYVGNSLNTKRNSEYSVKGEIVYTDDELNNEIWIDATKIIPELRNKEYFMVSNLGRYKVYKRNNRWNTVSIQTITPKVSMIYPKTTITHNGKQYHFSVHKLVALCFLREPKEGEIIDHIDSNTNNPRLSNLQIITIKENNKKAIKKDDKGANNGMSKHNESEIVNVLNDYYYKGLSKSEIGKNHNMNINTVTRIVLGQTYQSIFNGYISKDHKFPERPTQYELQSLSRKGKIQKKLTCPHCGKTGGNTNMVRYHFDNCKNK